jgi:hypothetical protein
MDDRPQEDRAEDRRRRGPLGDEEDVEETTRRGPRRVSREEDAETGRIPPEDDEREDTGETATDTPASGRHSPRDPDEEEAETRVIRAPGAHVDEATTPSSSYPAGYPEGPEMREARLREIYGGVDFLASFIGCVFALVCLGVLLSFSALVLGFLGLTLNLGDQEIDAAIIPSLVVIGLVLFVAYFSGGYVAGRLSRFDGGRNGAATVLWGILLSVLLALFGSILPVLQFVQEFAQASLLPAISGLVEAGVLGLVIVIGALLLEVLGGFLGGRLGNSYHTRIDETN